MKAVSKQATIYDVARLAGVSSATVSRVLNEPDRVASEKKARVQFAIKELNFVPKAEAVAKARSAYKRIGVVAPFFTQPSFMERLRGIASVLCGEHYELVIYSIDTNKNLVDYIQMLVNTQRVDGLIFLCITLEDNMLELLKNASFPVCFVENEYEDFDCVVIPNLQGGQKAAQFLFSKGCKKPGFIGEKSSLSYSVQSTEERLRGFKFFCANNGILLKDEHIWLGDFQEGNLDEGITRFLQQDDLPDGIFCSSDVIAARFIRIALTSGFSIPRDFKIIGFDNIDIAQYLGLTSVSQSLEESGKTAARMVLDRIKDRGRGVTSIKLPVSVIERETTGK